MTSVRVSLGLESIETLELIPVTSWWSASRLRMANMQVILRDILDVDLTASVEQITTEFDRQRRRSVFTVLLLASFCVPFAPASASAARFQYDPAGRLVRVIYADLSSIAYEYDASGNLLSVTTTGSGSPGDADLDGDIDDADIAAIVAIILDGGQPYSPTADCNGDDRVSVADLACTVTVKGPP